MPFERRDIERMLGDPWELEVPPFCPKCWYLLTGSPGHRCPECGTPIVRSAIAAEARKLQWELRRMSHINNLVKVGLKFAAVGGACLALGLLRADHTPSLGEAGRLVTVVCGMPAVALGLNVFRVKRFPGWSIEYLPERPDFRLGVLTALMGVLLITLSVGLP